MKDKIWNKGTVSKKGTCTYFKEITLRTKIKLSNFQVSKLRNDPNKKGKRNVGIS